MRVDAHVHVWTLARGDYDWLTPDLGVLFRDFTLADLEPTLLEQQIDAVILVQAAPTEAETAFLLETAGSDLVLGVIGWVDFGAEDAAARIRHFSTLPKAIGVRPMLQDIPEPGWILAPTRAAAIDACADTGLVFDALVRPHQLNDVVMLAERYPALQIVIDHGAKPDIASGDFVSWAGAIDRAAACPNIACKLSGLLTEAAPGAAVDALRRYAAHLLARFGADRLIWGSDWPVVTLTANYRDWQIMAGELLADLQESARQGVFGRNAQRIYRLGMARAQAPAAILLHPDDNVAVCCRALQEGEPIDIAGLHLIAREAVDLGHKLALRPLDSGDKVVKYGAPIGSITRPVEAGGWVHMHNMKSDYISAHTRAASGGHTP